MESRALLEVPFHIRSHGHRREDWHLVIQPGVSPWKLRLLDLWLSCVLYCRLPNAFWTDFFNGDVRLAGGFDGLLLHHDQHDMAGACKVQMQVQEGFEVSGIGAGGSCHCVVEALTAMARLLYTIHL